VVWHEPLRFTVERYVDLMSLVRIGTRASPLAQAQSRQMQAASRRRWAPPPEEADRVAPLVLITTTGDRVQDRRLLEIGGKQLFTKEIEEALLDGHIDCAVHSMKDVPALMPPGLLIAATPEREDPRDAFVSPDHAAFEALPQGRGARHGQPAAAGAAAAPPPGPASGDAARERRHAAGEAAAGRGGGRRCWRCRG
jgi:hypothetical protein